MNGPLPVRPRPEAGESLSGYTRRLESANGLGHGALRPSLHADVGTPAAALNQLARLSTVPVSRLTEMTLDSLPGAVIGTGPNRLHGWRLRAGAAWQCDNCTDGAGYRGLLWRLALMPICLRCARYLSRRNKSGHRGSAPPELVELGQRLQGAIDEARRSESPESRQRLSSYLRLNQLVAATVTEYWPPRPAVTAPISLEIARTWGAYPPSDPATVAGLLLATAPALHSHHAERQLLEEAIARRRGKHPAGADLHPRRRRRTSTALAQPVPDRRSNRQRLDDLRQYVRFLVAERGITVDHIPALLPRSDDPGGFPPLSVIPYRHDRAIALQFLIAQAAGCSVSVTWLRNRMRGLTTTRPLFFRDPVDDRGVSTEDAEHLTAGLNTLIASPPIDYHYRRETLRTVTHLPTRLVRGIATDGQATVTSLALGWIWQRLTHGHVDTSRLRQVSDRQIRELDARLDPEHKLALLEHAEASLSATDDLISAHQQRLTELTATNDRRHA